MSEFEDTDSILRNIGIDEDIEIENEFLTEDDEIASPSLEEEDICVESNITELPELPTLVFVDENNIQNVVEWKGTETTGKQKGSKGTLMKDISERGSSCWKCNKSYNTKKFSDIHLKDCCVLRKGNVNLLCKFNLVSFCMKLLIFREERCLGDVTTK